MRFLIWCALAAALIGGLFVWAEQALGDAPDLSGVNRASQPEWWSEAPRRPVLSPPPIRTISILAGQVLSYSVVSGQGYVTLDLLMRVKPAAYKQLPAFRNCLGGCFLRVYIVQGRE